MSTQSDSPAERDQRLQEIIHRYLQAVDTGQTPDRQAFLKQHFEFAEELREFFADLDRIEEAVQVIGQDESALSRGVQPDGISTMPPADHSLMTAHHSPTGTRV